MSGFLFVCLVSAVFAQVDFITHPNIDVEFNTWKQEHGVSYSSDEEHTARKNIFQTNHHIIARHNAMNPSFTMKLNHFADLSQQEFAEKFASGRGMKRLASMIGNYDGDDDRMIGPKSDTEIDWRKLNAVTSVKNQGGCASCYSFAVTGSIEGMMSIYHNNLTSLSAQEAVDCEPDVDACNGGDPYNTFKWITSNGVCSEAAYPYKGVKGNCLMSGCSPAAKISGFTRAKGEKGMHTAIFNQPIMVALEAANTAWQFYDKGIIDPTKCKTDLNHCVLVVGLVKYPGQSGLYWLIKNSWGEKWGMQGFALLPVDVNACNLGAVPAFPKP